VFEIMLLLRGVHALFLRKGVLQVLDRDKARMNSWLHAVATIRPQEANVIIAALDQKCDKIFAV